MEDKNNTQRIKFQNISFEIQIFDQNTCQITATDFNKVSAYYSQKIKLELIKVDTIIAALEKKIPQISAEITFKNPKNQQQKLIQSDDIQAAQQQALEEEKDNNQQDENIEKEGIMNLLISVNYEYIHSFQEQIILVENLEIQEDKIIKNQLLQQGQTLQNLKNQIEKLQKNSKQFRKPQSVYIPRGQQFSGGSHTIVNQFLLAKGKYEIQISFFAKSQSNWIYLTLDQKGKDLLGLQQQGWYVDNSQVQHPSAVSLKVITNIDSQFENIRLISNYCNSYPWSMANFVMTAIPI